jgi:hypothetical protein
MLAVKSPSRQFNIEKRLIVRVYQCARATGCVRAPGLILREYQLARQIELEQIVARAYPKRQCRRIDRATNDNGRAGEA